jgi:hypothetical protein
MEMPRPGQASCSFGWDRLMNVDLQDGIGLGVAVEITVVEIIGRRRTTIQLAKSPSRTPTAARFY